MSAIQNFFSGEEWSVWHDPAYTEMPVCMRTWSLVQGEGVQAPPSMTDVVTL